jgi:hypothetical protein
VGWLHGKAGNQLAYFMITDLQTQLQDEAGVAAATAVMAQSPTDVEYLMEQNQHKLGMLQVGLCLNQPCSWQVGCKQLAYCYCCAATEFQKIEMSYVLLVVLRAFIHS